MKGLKTLILMQLKDKVDLSFVKSTKQTIFKVVLSLIKFVAITAIIYFIFYILNFLRLVSILPGIPQNFLTVVFTIMFLMSIFVCTFGLTKGLYFSKDNALLLTMPTSRLAVFVSKLVVFFIYELLRNVFYLMPLFVAYGIINSLPLYFYPWLVVTLPALTLLSVSIGALLSIAAMQMAKLLKSHKWLEYLFVLLVVGGAVFGIVSIIIRIPENIDIVASWGTTFWKIQNFMTAFVKIFMPFSWVVTAVVGKRIGVANVFFSADQLLAFLGIILVGLLALAVTFLIVRPLFFKMVSFPFEYKKKEVNKTLKNKKNSHILSALKKDFATYYRTPEKFYSLITVVFGLPIAILLLNTIYSAMDTRLTGMFMTTAFNILVILLFALSSNAAVSHIYSEEGASSYLLKTFPRKPLSIAFSKLLINLVTVGISLLAAVIIFTRFSGHTVLQTILIYLSLFAVYIGHLLWAAESDIMNPQTHHYQTTGTHISNPNETKTIITAVLLSAFVAFVTFFLLPENQVQVWYKLLFVSLAFLASRAWLFVNKVNIYFKERQ